MTVIIPVLKVTGSQSSESKQTYSFLYKITQVRVSLLSSELICKYKVHQANKVPKTYQNHPNKLKTMKQLAWRFPLFQSSVNFHDIKVIQSDIKMQCFAMTIIMQSAKETGL